jgi:hypothetical protein
LDATSLEITRISDLRNQIETFFFGGFFFTQTMSLMPFMDVVGDMGRSGLFELREKLQTSFMTNW